jgi:hypothetical protein
MSVLAGPGDRTYVRDVVHHLRRAAQFEFTEITLVYDDIPRRGRGLVEAEFVATVNGMLAAGEVTKLISLNCHVPDAAAPHFSRSTNYRRDYRGIPLHGWSAGFEASKAKYFFHSDCDIFIHADSGYSWIAEAIEALRQNESLLFVSPRGGPLQDDGDVGSLSLRKGFSSRRFVTQRDRFASLLPLALNNVSSRRTRLAALFGLRSPIDTWEMHIDRALRDLPYFSAYLNDKRAWSLHSPNHSPEWKGLVPSIIKAVERGEYPTAQIGTVELELDAWRSFLRSRP